MFVDKLQRNIRELVVHSCSKSIDDVGHPVVRAVRIEGIADQNVSDAVQAADLPDRPKQRFFAERPYGLGKKLQRIGFGQSDAFCAVINGNDSFSVFFRHSGYKNFF